MMNCALKMMNCADIGVVAQDNVLFSTSLYNNIVYGMGQGHLKEPTLEEVRA